MNYILNAITQVQAKGKRSIEVTTQAEARYTERIHHEMAKTVWQQGGCSSWYKSKSGKVIAMFPGFTFTYRRWTRTFRPNDHQFG